MWYSKWQPSSKSLEGQDFFVFQKQLGRKWKITSSNKGYLQKLSHWYWRINLYITPTCRIGFSVENLEHWEFPDCALWINETQPKNGLPITRPLSDFPAPIQPYNIQAVWSLNSQNIYSLYHWYRPFHPWRGSYGSWWCHLPSYLSDQIQNIFSYARKEECH